MSDQGTGQGRAQAASLRHWIRLVAVYLLIPLVLLICGGDIGWWQAWLYSIMIIAAGIGGRIWAERRHPGVTARRQDAANLRNAKAWDKLLAPLMAISIVYPLVIVAGLDHRYGWSPPFPLWLNAVGFVLIAAGYAFGSWALAENRFFFAMTIIRTDLGHRVCDTGPYRFVRHPGYAGNIFPLFGIVLGLGSLWALLPAVAALLITVLRTALEDRTLHQELQGYRDYAQRVRYRLVPGVY